MSIYFFRGLLYMCLCVYIYIGKYSVQQLVFSSSCLLTSGRFWVIFARKKQNCDVRGKPAIRDFVGFMISQKHYAQPLCTAFVKTKKKCVWIFVVSCWFFAPRADMHFLAKPNFSSLGQTSGFFQFPPRILLNCIVILPKIPPFCTQKNNI